ncbi:hypothetical protein CK203_045125 [Vitis vinifera]|uniref:Protein kinase domain-containing protein n=1 Tax=Vitis vinifera TaxID=29760 RepID=A0A438HD22_VITVI|nr:hypothetical protein CK203_045125 [Vitis vinifera]
MLVTITTDTQRSTIMVSRKRSEMIEGFTALHGKNIVHFDLKSDNLLVNLRDPHRPICKRLGRTTGLWGIKWNGDKLDSGSAVRGLRDCELIDPLRNATSTWSNLQWSSICKELDRFLYSLDWDVGFSNSLQESLPCPTSDHCQMGLDTNPSKWGPTPFRFESMKAKLKLWNKDNFGNIKEKKEAIIKDITMVDFYEAEDAL